MTHPNEIKVTEQNKQELLMEAEAISSKHVDALMEQIKRQSEK